jgi:hypothetical protein
MVKMAHENHFSWPIIPKTPVFQARYPDGLSGGAFFRSLGPSRSVGSDSGRGLLDGLEPWNLMTFHKKLGMECHHPN